jgi:hypothetical protein
VAQEAKIFKYQTPEFDGVKKSMIVCSSDLMKVMVQVRRKQPAFPYGR